VKLIDRYIVYELAVPFFLGLIVFTSILLIVRILKLVEMVVSRGVPLFQVLKLFSYILPAFLEVTVPMALLLAILVAFGRLSSDSEIVALQASGTSVYRLAFPVALFAIGATLVTLTLSSFVRPWGNLLLRSGLYEIVKTRATAGIKAKVFSDDFDRLVIYVDRIEPPGQSLRGVLISDTRDPDLHNTIYARVGIIVSDEDTQTLTLRLVDGGIYTTGPGGAAFQDTRFSTYDINLDLTLTLAKLIARGRDPSELTVGELWNVIRRKEHAGEAAYEERVELHRKFSIPFACIVFAALGIPLGIRPSRSVHSRGFSISLVLIFAYYLLLTLGENLGERGKVWPGIALWIPNIVLSVVSITLLARTASDSGPVQGVFIRSRLPFFGSRAPSRLGVNG
jgi:lipopolysaccharide export system permease protein